MISLSPGLNNDETESVSTSLGSKVVLTNNTKNLNKIQQIFKPLLRNYHQPLSDKPSIKERFKHLVLCPPIELPASLILWIILIFILYGILWSILLKNAEPGSHYFALYILVTFCLIGGWIVSFVKLPPLLGMLIVGLILKNVPNINIGGDLDKQWSSSLRTVSLVVILTRAGLGLDPGTLKQLKGFCIRLALLPCLTEALIAGFAAHYILNFDWLWGFLLGFVLTAVSPAVIVPAMLHLQEENLGVDQGIPTVVMAAASLDDVLAITLFSLLLGIVFSTGNLIYTIFHGPIEIIIGIVYGIVFGIIVWFIPSKTEENITVYRVIIVFAGGLFAVFGSRAIDFSGAGPLGCLVFVFVAGVGWRKKDSSKMKKVANFMAGLWIIFQPILFGLIGVEIDINKLDGPTVGLCLVVMFIGLLARWLMALLTTIKSGLNIKEKIFVSIARLPKATVQAAIGSLALDTARLKHMEDKEDLGIKILTIAVLEILVTAPLGAAALNLTASKFLKKGNSEEDDSKRNEDIELHV